MELESGQDKTPLNNLLSTVNPLQQEQYQLFTCLHQDAPVAGLYMCQRNQEWPGHQDNTAEMFLKPGKITKGEKPLLTVDFVNNIAPQDKDETLENQGNAKIFVTYGPKKPKLESVSVQQWVVANTHIFYTLLSEGKLASKVSIRDYLAYSIKIMELSSKYEWKTILLYNNEFRKLQAIYGFPRGFNSTHLHVAMLQPIIKANQTVFQAEASFENAS